MTKQELSIKIKESVNKLNDLIELANEDGLSVLVSQYQPVNLLQNSQTKIKLNAPIKVKITEHIEY